MSFHSSCQLLLGASTSSTKELSSATTSLANLLAKAEAACKWALSVDTASLSPNALPKSLG
eukprot:9105760-Alexandrium_andersonii.AAC.1